jgi:hypothetical protein
MQGRTSESQPRGYGKKMVPMLHNLLPASSTVQDWQWWLQSASEGTWACILWYYNEGPCLHPHQINFRLISLKGAN